MSTDEFTGQDSANETAGGTGDSLHGDELDALLALLQRSPGLMAAGVEIIVPVDDDAGSEDDPAIDGRSILRAEAALRRRRCWRVFPGGGIICIPPR